MNPLEVAAGLLLVWLLVAAGVISTMVVLDFLVIGRHGRLDWIANLFRRENEQDK